MKRLAYLFLGLAVLVVIVVVVIVVTFCVLCVLVVPVFVFLLFAAACEQQDGKHDPSCFHGDTPATKRAAARTSPPTGEIRDTP